MALGGQAELVGQKNHLVIQWLEGPLVQTRFLRSFCQLLTFQNYHRTHSETGERHSQWQGSRFGTHLKHVGLNVPDKHQLWIWLPIWEWCSHFATQPLGHTRG